MAQMNMIEAIRSAHDVMMERDPTVVVLGTVTIPGACPNAYSVTRTWIATAPCPTAGSMTPSGRCAEMRSASPSRTTPAAASTTSAAIRQAVTDPRSALAPCRGSRRLLRRRLEHPANPDDGDWNHDDREERQLQPEEFDSRPEA